MRVFAFLTMILLASHSTYAEATPRVLFSFEGAAASEQWKNVNDGVMGGRSEGRFEITEDNTLKFFGRLSLERNGGFASVRSRPMKLNLKPGETLVARVRGDGRTYSFNLYVPTRRMAFSYRVNFETKAGEWIEVELPLEKLVATSFGRVQKNQSLEATQVNGLGILLGDKKAGPFELEVDWIKVKSAKP